MHIQIYLYIYFKPLYSMKCWGVSSTTIGPMGSADVRPSVKASPSWNFPPWTEPQLGFNRVSMAMADPQELQLDGLFHGKSH